MKIVVTGANGQLSTCIQDITGLYPMHQFIFLTSADLDITKLAAVKTFFAKEKPDWCINCAAYTAVDKAETENKIAYNVNVRGVKNLAIACSLQLTRLVHISSDYVYHTTQNTPYVETDKVSPKSVYARTKLQGDLAALKYQPNTIVLRTSWVYSQHGHNFVKSMLKFGTERPLLRVVYDQIGTPTYAPDLAQCILQIIGKLGNTHQPTAPSTWGVYHYSNEGVTSWYDFAQAIFEMENISCLLEPIRSAQYPTPAQRPPFSVLSKQKIKDHFQMAIPHWRDSLKICLAALKN